jgi:hypothetical protein
MVPRIVGTIAAVVLVGLGTLHCYWAAGGQWATDVTIPKRGGEPLFTPRPAGTLLVALLLYVAALVLLGRLGLWGRGVPHRRHSHCGTPGSTSRSACYSRWRPCSLHL